MKTEKSERSRKKCHSREDGNPELKFKNSKFVTHVYDFFVVMFMAF
jgi:hypothetical protein